MPKPRLRWRKEPNERGLASTGQAPRGAELWYGNERIATVTAGRHGSGFGPPDTWSWSARSDHNGVPWRNSAAEGRYWPLTDEGLEAAKADCRAYVERCLGRAIPSN